MPRHVLITAFALVATFAQPAPLAALCSGSYALQAGPTIGRSGGIAVQHQPAQSFGTGRIDVARCGTEFTLTVQGRPMRFLPSPLDDTTWIGTLSGGGAVRSFILSETAPGLFAGEMIATGSGIVIRRPLLLRGSDLGAPDMTGCTDPGEAEPAPARGVTAPEAALSRVLGDRGITPPAGSGLATSDYIRVTDTPDGFGNAAVHLALSVDGAILPHIDPDTFDVDLCQDGPRLDPPRKLLDFKIHEVEGTTYVFARVIDIETSRIEAQAEGMAPGEGPDAMATAMDTAWTALNPATGPMTDGQVR